MSTPYLTHITRTLEQIAADGMMKSERLIASPQGAEIVVGDSDVINCAPTTI